MQNVEPSWTRGELAVWVVTRSRESVGQSSWLEDAKRAFVLDASLSQGSALNPRHCNPLARIKALNKAEATIDKHIQKGTLRPNPNGTFPIRQVLGKRNWPPKTGRGRGRLPLTHYAPVRKSDGTAADPVRKLAHYIRTNPKSLSLSQDDLRRRVFGRVHGSSLRNIFHALLQAAIRLAEKEIKADLRLYRAVLTTDKPSEVQPLGLSPGEARSQRANVKTYRTMRRSRKAPPN